SFDMDICFDTTLGILVADRFNDRLRAIANLGEATNSPPTAIIVASSDFQGSVPFKITFDGTHSTDPDNDIIDYVWDFGDGTTAEGPIVEHTYTTMGAFTVTL